MALDDEYKPDAILVTTSVEELLSDINSELKLFPLEDL